MQRTDYAVGGQEVERGVEEGKGGSLAGGLEGAALGQAGAPFDVAGRQGPQRAAHIRRPEIGQVAFVERGEPRIERARWGRARIHEKLVTA